MNELTLLNNFIIERFHSNSLVNTISNVETEVMDLNKTNIYPLVNFDLLESDVINEAIIASYKMTIVQARDVKPVKTSSKLQDDSNLIDNLNETHSIAVKFINYLTRQNNFNNIEIETLSALTILKNWRSGLDGVQFDIELTIPNTGTAC